MWKKRRQSCRVLQTHLYIHTCINAYSTRRYLYIYIYVYIVVWKIQRASYRLREFFIGRSRACFTVYRENTSALFFSLILYFYPFFAAGVACAELASRTTAVNADKYISSREDQPELLFNVYLLLFFRDACVRKHVFFF